ncbi:uncharacterized protein LOC125185684 [Salvia hispanica]|uniref:uncharacterized protein LOC125185684 n=1 Tax=Salvia hispanica TaxID=49212 RepID=UPI0020094BDB|nr:uncharacterized protein LOC125185684 [Salvia hispanica]
MAVAEARAVLHRTANRCMVQEDAKRAPKFAYCSTIPTSVKQADTVSSASRGLDVPNGVSIPFNLNPSFINLSPNSKWWLQPQLNYGYQKGSTNQQFTSSECSMDIWQKHESSGALVRNEDNQGRNIVTGEKLEFGVKEDDREVPVKDLGPKVPKHADEISFDPKSRVGAGKNAPWWRTADTDELALLVAQRSLDYIENCDLPMPQNTHVKKDVDVKLSCFCHDGSACDKHFVLAEGQSENSTEKLFSDIPTLETTVENDQSKAQLMEALCHSQTRAREAERAAKQACAEKEHVVKLVFRQASQLFAYKQWLRIESMYLQFLNSSSQSVVPMVPWAPQITKKAQTARDMTSSRNRAKNSSSRHEASKCTVAFTIGLGLAGAGFLLGWSIAWMFPSW